MHQRLNYFSIFNTKTILITGGTGSFGRAFVTRMLKEARPKAVRIYSRDELKQHEMRVDLKDDPRLRFFIGDVRDEARLFRACEGAEFVIHAAAIKQVPACEYNPIEAIKTNIGGAMNVVEAALNACVKKVIALSSDKAVSPVNLYGATKLCAEKLFVQANSYAGPRKTKFSVVRYGNVIASRGSVIPLFLDQMKRGEQLTLTDGRMTRFWITLNHAADFVASCIKIAVGGEIFVPKIPSMKLIDLIQALNYKKGYIAIGVRPGEKLHEYLITEEEGSRTISLGDRYVIHPQFPWWSTNSYKTIKEMPAEFTYNSRDNTEWISVKEMRKLIGVLHVS